MHIRDIRKLKQWRGKRVFLRVDFNVRIVGGRVHKNDLVRIKAGLGTINWLRRRGARLILATHIGRPQGRKISELSTKPIAAALGRMGVPTRYVDDIVGRKARAAVGRMKNGEVLLLENLRFHRGETDSDKGLAARLAGLADVFVNDAFAVSHRRHASVFGVARLLPAYAGLRLEEEVRMLRRVLRGARRPLVVVIGGAKIRTKLPVIKNLLRRADNILLGGALANTFFLAQGLPVGESLVERSLLPAARRLLKNKKLVLPVDVLTLPRRGAPDGARVRKLTELNRQDYIVDIGPKTVRRYVGIINTANTLIWNGPVGVCEVAGFARGSHALARALIRRASGQAFGLVGGGDTLPCIAGIRGLSKIDFISTGGGAMLEYLAGRKLPGLLFLMN